MIWICSRIQVKVIFCLLLCLATAFFTIYFVLLETRGEMNQIPQLCINGKEMKPYVDNLTVTEVVFTYEEPTQPPSPDMTMLRKKSFCSKMRSSFMYFQEVCESATSAPINYSPKPLANDQLGLTPVAIIGTNRSDALYRTLRALTSADGVDPSLITVFFDGIFKEPTYVVKLFNVQVQYNEITPTLTVIPQNYAARSKYFKNRIDRHYKLSLDKLFTIFPDAKQAIILEDDLEVSPDFFSYFNQTIGLLRNDPSLYCISAWNDFLVLLDNFKYVVPLQDTIQAQKPLISLNHHKITPITKSFQHSSQDPTLLYRVDTMPGLGWVLTRSLYEEVAPKWPTESEPLTWDGWIREPAQRKGRECIIPDVCRTFHFSKSGAHISAVLQKRLFEIHSFNRHPNFHQLQTTSLTEKAYEELMTNLIKHATPVDHSLSLCSDSMIPNTKNQTYVIYIQGFNTQLRAMQCFKLWDVDIRPGHKDSFRFWNKGNHVILIRCNDSPYCKYKPEGLPLIKVH